MKRQTHGIACPRLWEAEAVHDGRLGAADVARHARHAAQCAECRDLGENLSRLRALARSAPRAQMSLLQVRRLRAATLQAAAQPRATTQPARPWIAAIAAAACLVVAARWSFHRSPTQRLNARHYAQLSMHLTSYPEASIQAVGEANWSRRETASEEVITLLDGALEVHVPSQHQGHRFRLTTPDGEIEVWGTRFAVAVHAGVTDLLDVREGVVAWRRQHATPVVLAATERWAPPVAALPIAEPTRAARPRVPVSAHERQGPAGMAGVRPDPTPSLSVFAQGVRAMDRGDFAVAAQSFEAFCTASPADERAEDAAYLRIVALARAGHASDSEQAALQFLAHYPSALRRWEAALLVAHAALARSDCSHLESVLREFAHDARHATIVDGLRDGCAHQ